MRYSIVAGLACLALAACQQEEGLLRASTSDSQATCEAKGGTWGRGGLLPEPQCIAPSPDAGKSCSSESDCTGFCLADTRTCSPTTPFFGCHAILMEDGARAEICVD